MKSAHVSHSPKAVRRQLFGHALRAAMLNNGVRQIQLAKIAGVPRDCISGYCNGENIPGNDRLKKIAAILNMKPQDLLPRQPAPQRQFITMDQGDGSVWVYLDRIVSPETAAKICAVIQQDNANLS